MEQAGDMEMTEGSRLPRILFSPKPSVERMLATKLKGFEASYRPFDDPALDPDDHDLVVPLRLDAMRFLNSPAGARLRPKALLPSDAVLDLCSDKLAFARKLLSFGYGANIPAIEGDFTPPYMLKKRQDEWGKNSHIIRSGADEERLGALLASPDYYRQEFVPGAAEYATHMLVHGTDVTYCGTVRIDFAAADTVFREGVKPLGFTRAHNPDHVRLFARILVQIGFEGLCCFDYKVVDGVAKIFELNPRFGGSLAFTPNGAFAAYAKIVAARGGNAA